MRHSIVLILLALSPLCAFAQGTSSSSDDLKVTLKAEPGYKKQKRVVKTWSIYPARRVVYKAPETKGSKTNNQPLLVKTYVDPTQKRMPASFTKPVVSKPVVTKPVMAKTQKLASVKTPLRKSAKAAVQTAPVEPVAAYNPPTMTANQTLVLEPMTIKAPKSKPITKTQKISSLSPYQAGMAKVVRASSSKKSSGMMGRQQKIALNK
ncbi:hypothetical protein [Bdellovibrio sp. HCB288]|uniref:hypothetical protein n=1 Tax=Bdellovibrio sp. HCB288 TaxID=3394355 RepID=UPI0039B36E42